MARIAIDIKKGSLQQSDVVVGIDLGTTNSLIAWVNPESGQAECLGEAGGLIVPSIVHIKSEGNAFAGKVAKNALIQHPETTIFSVKRLLGRSYADIEDHASHYTYRIIDEGPEQLVKIAASDKYFSPVELSAAILVELKKQGEAMLGKTIDKAVISVPAYFNDSQRQATRDAGKIAGLDVLRIVNEPTAASLAYGLGLDSNLAKTILVYDLGGGTFDVSVLLIENGIFEVLSTNGDTYLGGDDVDRGIASEWIKNAGLSIAELEAGVRQELRLKAEEAKIAISNGAAAYHDILTRENLKLDLRLSEDELEAVVSGIVGRTMQCVAAAIKDAGLKAADIEEVVLVGGSTRLPGVRRMLHNTFGKARVNHRIDADQVVALGAAIEADILAGNRKDILLLDVTPLSLGIETAGGLMDVIIPRNNKIPAKAGRQYTTSVDGQINMKISVYQGERELVSENRKLAEFDLKGIPAMPAGLPKVEVTFFLDADGILKVSATEQRSGVSQHVEIKPQYGLSDDMVESMLFDSLKHAGSDMAARLLLESQNEGRQLIYTAERFIEKNRQMLTAEEVDQTLKLISELETVLSGTDRDSINRRMENLNDYTRPFAERLMDQAVGMALKGKSVDP